MRSIRWQSGVAAHAGCACAAASMALATSSGVPSGTCAKTSPVAGFSSEMTSSEWGFTQTPLMKKQS